MTFASGEDFPASPIADHAMCVLLDYRMHGMQGADVQRQLVEDQRHILVVLMSAHGDANTVRLAMQHGAVGFLRKPFAQDALFDLILAAVEKRER